MISHDFKISSSPYSQKAHLITGSPRMISSEDSPEIWKRFHQKKNVFGKNTVLSAPELNSQTR